MLAIEEILESNNFSCIFLSNSMPSWYSSVDRASAWFNTEWQHHRSIPVLSPMIACSQVCWREGISCHAVHQEVAGVAPEVNLRNMQHIGLCQEQIWLPTLALKLKINEFIDKFLLKTSIANWLQKDKLIILADCVWQVRKTSNTRKEKITIHSKSIIIHH